MDRNFRRQVAHLTVMPPSGQSCDLHLSCTRRNDRRNFQKVNFLPCACQTRCSKGPDKKILCQVNVESGVAPGKSDATSNMSQSTMKNRSHVAHMLTVH